MLGLNEGVGQSLLLSTIAHLSPLPQVLPHFLTVPVYALVTAPNFSSLFSFKDSPQVQCLRAYKPRENDELALEKADVVMVTQQSSDGKRESP